MKYANMPEENRLTNSKSFIFSFYFPYRPKYNTVLAVLPSIFFSSSSLNGLTKQSLKKNFLKNTDDSPGMVACSQGEPIEECVPQLDTDCVVETEAETQFKLAEFKILQEGEDLDGNQDEHCSKLSPEPDTLEKSHFKNMQEGEELYDRLDMQLSKLSCEPELIGKSRIEVGCGVKSLDVNEEREFSSNNQLQNVHVL